MKTAPLHSLMRLFAAPAIFAAMALASIGCLSNTDTHPGSNSNQAEEKQSEPPHVKETQTGLAAYYSDALHGRRTYSGEVFNNSDMVAAHPSYPMGTIVRITNLKNNLVVEVRIVDRGPSKKDQDNGLIIDLSKSAAKILDFIRDGTASVRAEALEWGDVR